MRKLILVIGVIVLLLFGLSGRFLVVDKPEKADVIVVLAGETKFRPIHGLHLLQQGYAPRMILDVPADATIYQWTQADLAKKWVESLPLADAISICPIHGLSTKDEARDVDRCLAALRAQRILLVTSDYHTRRALSVFRKEIPAHTYSVAAARDPQEFGTWWWNHRQWAKTNLNECTKLLWWEVVDRWR